MLKARESGVTLIEIIIVVALMAGIMIYALPNINTSTRDYITKINLFTSSLKNAFDTAVLTGKPHRLVIDFTNGEYWLETTHYKDFKVSPGEGGLDLSSEQLKSKREEDESDFEEYEELAGQTTTDPESGDEIRPESPLLKAKNTLLGPSWFQVDSVDWETKNIGIDLKFTTIQAEHHEDRIVVEELEEGSVGHIYIFPNGYLEKAYVVISPVDSDGQIMEGEEPFTIETFPYEGIAKVEDGLKEFVFESEEN